MTYIDETGFECQTLTEHAIHPWALGGVGGPLRQLRLFKETLGGFGDALYGGH